ncbi:hypothetical protein VNO78_05693 [Psophocarpus tetragonolobus]|uniref:Uncharacterized protein n=1 Tax=Psophocarpus tetragonolobus TaxID=3891 RepID=A0AAN9XQM2_PSOTE
MAKQVHQTKTTTTLQLTRKLRFVSIQRLRSAATLLVSFHTHIIPCNHLTLNLCTSFFGNKLKGNRSFNPPNSISISPQIFLVEIQQHLVKKKKE